MAIPEGIRAVFFDAVGTLIHPEPTAATAYAEAARRFGSRLTAAQIAPRFRLAFHREEQRDRAERLRTSEARETERWRNIVAEVLPDVTDPEACFAWLFAHFGRPDAWRLVPDAGATIRTLASRGYLVGLASNYDRRLRMVAGELLPMVAHLVISSEVGWRKPAGEFFASLCGSVAMSPDRVFYVGDDPVNDYEGARAAGLAAVLFDPAGKSKDTASRIDRLSELLE